MTEKVLFPVRQKLKTVGAEAGLHQKGLITGLKDMENEEFTYKEIN